jgi:hypothetical protein
MTSHGRWLVGGTLAGSGFDRRHLVLASKRQQDISRPVMGGLSPGSESGSLVPIKLSNNATRWWALSRDRWIQ